MNKSRIFLIVMAINILSLGCGSVSEVDSALGDITGTWNLSAIDGVTSTVEQTMAISGSGSYTITSEACTELGGISVSLAGLTFSVSSTSGSSCENSPGVSYSASLSLSGSSLVLGIGGTTYTYTAA